MGANIIKPRPYGLGLMFIGWSAVCKGLFKKGLTSGFKNSFEWRYEQGTYPRRFLR
jgi:hypothetical protein